MTAGRFLFDAVVAASAALILAWLAGLALRRAPAALSASRTDSSNGSTEAARSR